MLKKKSDDLQENETTTDEIPFRFILEEGKKFAQKDFAKFSAIAAIIFSAGLWYIKSIWYVYWAGIFSVYRIDKCYINTDNENIFLQVIQLVSIFIICVFANYVYYKISVTKDKSKFCIKRKLKKLTFWLIELFIVYVIASFINRAHLFELNGKVTVTNVVVTVFALIMVCLSINIYAIDFLHKEKSMKNKNVSPANIENEHVTVKHLKDIIFVFVITMAIEIVLIYCVSAITEKNRIGYKMILTQREESQEEGNVIQCAMDNNKYEMCPVVYENQDCYIITRLYREDGNIKIDYNFQRIIEKNGQEIIYVKNVYNIDAFN